MAPHVLVAFGGNPTSNSLSYVNNICIQSSMDEQDSLAAGQQLLAQVIEFLERAYLGDHGFIAGTSHATIADLACYEEIGQLQEANLMDLSGMKCMQAWLRRMRDLPRHDDVHRFNLVLGDIRSSPNTMERFSEAVTEAFSSLAVLNVHLA